MQKEDIKWLIENLLRALMSDEVEFPDLVKLAERNGYAINEDLDLEEING